MNNKINTSDNLHTSPQTLDLEFLEALLQPEDETYPWNVADEHSEEYFHEIEQQFVLQEVLDEELMPRSQAFFHQLDQLWEKHNSNSIQQTLHSNFGSRIPTNWLNIIANKATEIFNSKQSMTEQLVQCAQAVLPSLEIEDLLVLARPYAYAMRSNESQKVESVLGKVKKSEWTALSDIEQARISLAIAHYTFTELNNIESEV